MTLYSGEGNAEDKFALNSQQPPPGSSGQTWILGGGYLTLEHLHFFRMGGGEELEKKAGALKDDLCTHMVIFHSKCY